MQPRDQLTAREIQVSTLVWQGLTNREIAKIIGTTEQVVKNYLRKVYDKLGVADRLELALFCLHNRVVEGQKIALFRVGEAFHALSDTCTHRGGPLSEGTVEGAEVTCPWHGARFDIKPAQAKASSRRGRVSERLRRR